MLGRSHDRSIVPWARESPPPAPIAPPRHRSLAARAARHAALAVAAAAFAVLAAPAARAYTPPAGSLLAQNQRPRLLLTPTSAEALKIDLGPGGSRNAMFLKMKTYLANTSAGSAVFQIVRYELTRAVCALVEPATYRSSLISSYAGLSPTGGAIYDEATGLMAAIVFDWFYADMTSSQRSNLAAFIVAHMNAMRSTVGGRSSWNNHVYEEAWSTVLGPLALFGAAEQPSDIQTRLDTAKSWLDEFLAATNKAAGTTGGYGEGYYYWTRGLHGLMYHVWGFSTASGTDYYSQCNALRFMANFEVGVLRPHDLTSERFADGAVPLVYQNEAQSIPVLMFATGKYANGYAQYLLNLAYPNGINANTWSTSYGYYYTFTALLYPKTPPAAIDPAAEPLAKRFDGMQMVVWKSGPGQSDTFFLYKQNDKFAGHDHYDAGEFVIHKGAALAIDAGAYEGGDSSPNDHYSKYYRRTIAHNLVTVYDPAEKWVTPYGTWTNDGGQKWSGGSNGAPLRSADVTDGSSFDRGRIARYDEQAGYDYLQGDLTGAYSRATGEDYALTGSKKMAHYTREITFLRPAYFVVLDRVGSSDASFAKRWLLHSITQPAVSGTAASVAGGGTSFTGDLTTITNGSGRLFVRTVLPLQHSIVRRGGSGYEYWTSYDGSGSNPLPASGTGSPNEPGAWRIEVSPTVAATDDFFLHVLEPRASTVSTPAAVARIQNATVLGVHIQDATEDQVALFSADKRAASIGTAFSYTFAPTRTTRHVVAGLVPGSSWNLSYATSGGVQTVSLSPGTQLRATAAGVLAFETTLSGGATPPPDTTSPTVSLLDPSGGETVTGGTTYTIRWTSSDDVGVTSQDVQVSINAGAFQPIASNLSGSVQAANWTTPTVLAPTSALVKVIARDAAGNAGEGLPGAPMTLVPPPDTTAPQVSVTAPAGGETVTGGTTFTIRWSSSDNVGVTSHEVQVSLGGGSYQTIASNLSGATTSFAWTTPAVSASTSALVKVIARDAAGNVGSGTAASAMTLAPGSSPPPPDTTPPSVTVLSPNGGERYVSGTVVTISWASSDAGGSGLVRHDVYLSLQGGAWTPIATGLSGSATEVAWTVPDVTRTASAAIRVVATDGAGNSSADESDGGFKIDPFVPSGGGNSEPTAAATSAGGGSGGCAAAPVAASGSSLVPAGVVMSLLFFRSRRRCRSRDRRPGRGPG
jgi:hypothetical protein